MVTCEEQLTENTNPTESMHHNIPTWAAYNHLVLGPIEHLTRVAVPSLLPYPAHEWTTLYTVLRQSKRIHTKLVVLAIRQSLVLTWGYIDQLSRYKCSEMIAKIGYYVTTRRTTYWQCCELLGILLMAVVFQSRVESSPVG